MKASLKGLKTELHISPGLVAVALATLGVAVLWASQESSHLDLRPRLDALAYLAFGFSAAIWLLGAWRSQAGRWLAVVAPILLIYLAYRWLDITEVLYLLVIPTALAGALMGPLAAGASAVGATGLLWLQRSAVSPSDPALMVVALAAVWAMVAVMAAVYLPVYRVAGWTQEYLDRAQALMKEAGERQVELKEALGSLAYANQQLTRLNAMTQGLRQRAEEAQRTKEQFVAVVSHELRTPLNMIIGFTEMIVQAPGIYGADLPSGLLADLDIVLRNSRHLSDLIDDVLDLSQIEAEQMALSKERTSLRQIVEMAALAVRPLFESKGLYLDIQVTDDLPPLFCDPTRIRQVVLNLLSNAGRFTSTGGVRLSAWQEGPDIVTSVSDTGSGISHEAISKLFQPFQQLDSSIRRRYGGTGLGLAISKRFIELHEGKIWVESEQSVGTRFFFRLPIDPPVPPADSYSRWFSPYLSYEEHQRSSKRSSAAPPPRFVVLEKGNTLGRLLTRYLDGTEIVCVTDPREAVREMAQVPSQALLINDVFIDRAAWPFDDQVTLPQGAPVVACHLPGISDSTDALGAADYLVKPVSREDLLAALDRCGFAGRTLLLVDDDLEALHLFKRMLVSAGRGFRLLQATNGREALRILHEEHPDAVLLDLVMPNMDGFQFLAEKNQDPAVCDIPVIVISARDPMGQPIVSSTLAVTQRGGLSVPQLLACVETITRTLSTMRPTGDRAQTETPAD